jgi:hypothetical protein
MNKCHPDIHHMHLCISDHSSCNYKLVELTPYQLISSLVSYSNLTSDLAAILNLCKLRPLSRLDSGGSFVTCFVTCIPSNLKP